MDLFGDLPPPKENDAAAAGGTDKVGSDVDDIFGGLPPPKRAKKEEKINDDNKSAQTTTAQAQASTDSNATVACSTPRLYTCKSAVAARRGERDEMQDEHVLVDSNIVDGQEVSYYAVFDGHAGKNAASFAAEHMHTHVFKRLPHPARVEKFQREMKLCFRESFHAVDKELLHEASKHHPVWKDGCTATVLLVVRAAAQNGQSSNATPTSVSSPRSSTSSSSAPQQQQQQQQQPDTDVIYVANVGDTRAVLCRMRDDKPTPITLTKAHSPTMYEERQRIQKAGGVVKDGRVQGIMEVSRSLGDGRFKSLGVISTPDVRRCAITEKDPFVIVACDGLWDKLTPEDAVSFAHKELLKAQQDPQLTDDWARAQLVANKLVNEAVHRGSADNVTVVLILLKQNDSAQ